MMDAILWFFLLCIGGPTLAYVYGVCSAKGWFRVKKWEKDKEKKETKL